MKLLRRFFCVMFVMILGAGMLFAAGRRDATYPSRDITIVVPWGAGGGTDITVRVLG